VVTHYNNDKTYRVDDIDFSSTPGKKTFNHSKLGEVTLLKYFELTYKIRIKDPNQPLLVSMPKKRDIRRMGSSDPILLVPELCRMTGLTDRLRSNFRAMQEMAQCLKMEPASKLKTTMAYAARFVKADAETKILTTWGVKVDPTAVEIPARVLPSERVYLGKEVSYPRGNPDWDREIRHGMYTAASVTNWVVVVPQRQLDDYREFINCLGRDAASLKLQLSKPIEEVIPDDRPSTYQARLREVAQRRPAFVMVVLFRNNPEIYRMVKSEMMVRNAIPSQVITHQKCLAKDKQGRVKRSVATKVAVQIACKNGAVPWSVTAPMPDTMIVGFDTFHNKRGNKKSIGAMAASYDRNWCQYYSTVSVNSEFNELTQTMDSLFGECLRNFQERNGKMPKRVFFYRDGVGEGQLQHVLEVEVKKMVSVLETLETKPLLTFIVVSKRITPRFFSKDKSGNGVKNPLAGTIVDDVVTLPERHDFYLVSQETRQGTVNPTSFNVIYDDNKLPAERNQLLAYKLCHVYPNWPGTIRVPAPCQLAHKLAYLIGENELGMPHSGLKHLHYYL